MEFVNTAYICITDTCTCICLPTLSTRNGEHFEVVFRPNKKRLWCKCAIDKSSQNKRYKSNMVVLHLQVTISPSTMIWQLHLTTIPRLPLAYTNVHGWPSTLDAEVASPWSFLGYAGRQTITKSLYWLSLLNLILNKGNEYKYLSMALHQNSST